MPREDRAVSGLVGYLLVFTVALTGAVILTATGISALVESGESGPTATADRDVARLDSGVGSIVDGSPHRELWLDLNDHRVGYGPRYTIRITATGGGVGLDDSDAFEASGRALTYSVGDDQRIVYAGGLTSLDGEAGHVLRERPSVRITDSQVVLDLPVTEQAPRSPAAVSGSNVPVVLERTDARTVERVATGDGGAAVVTVNVTVEGDGAAAWGEYFDENDRLSPRDLNRDGEPEYTVDTDGDGTTDRAGATVQTRRLFLRAVSITVALDRTL